MSVNIFVPTDIECRTLIVKLPIEEPTLRELIDKNHGALWYPAAEVNEGALYVSSWFYAGVVMVAFHVEVAQPSTVRRFVLAPIHHAFKREPAVVLHPLGMIAIPASAGSALFTLYEATDDIRSIDTSN